MPDYIPSDEAVEAVAAMLHGKGWEYLDGEDRDMMVNDATRILTAAVPLELQRERERLLECEESLRSLQSEYDDFREQMLRPLKAVEGDSIESLSWDDLLGIAVRNLNEGMRLDTLVRRAAPFVNAVAAMAEDKTPSLAWLADAALPTEEGSDG